MVLRRMMLWIDRGSRILPIWIQALEVSVLHEDEVLEKMLS